MKRKLMCLTVVLLTMIPFVLGNTTSCSDADIANKNIAKAADYFQIDRRIVFYNGITDEYILSVEGKCSVDFFPDKFTVTCKVGKDQYLKHYLGRADNVFPFVEQLKTANVSAYRYKVVFKPSAILPDIDLNTIKNN